jgi:transcriptional regulator with XRE-family HTH domain
MDKDRFATIRRGAGLSQPELADLLRIAERKTISRYETGARPIPGPISLLMEMIDTGRLAVPTSPALAA